MKNYKKGFATGVLAGIGVAGVAYLLAKKGSQGWDMKGWAKDMREEVLEKAKAAKKLSRGEYFKIIDLAAEHYRNLQEVTLYELVDLIDDLKEEWGRIKEEMSTVIIDDNDEG